MLRSCLKAEIFSVKYSTKTQNLTHRIVKNLELKETKSVPIILISILHPKSIEIQ